MLYLFFLFGFNELFIALAQKSPIVTINFREATLSDPEIIFSSKFDTNAQEKIEASVSISYYQKIMYILYRFYYSS